MPNKPLVPILSLLVITLVGCEGMEGSGDDSSDEDSQLSITIRASNLTGAQSSDKPQAGRAVSADVATDLPAACNDFFLPGTLENGNYDDAGPRLGSCITPVNVTGHVDSINLGGDYFGGGIRLLGGGSGFGQNYTLEGTVINLADPLSLGGEDNAQDTEFAHHNSRVSTVFNYLDVQFAVPRIDDTTQDSTAEYWTYRYAFVPYPFSQEPVYTLSEPNPGDVTYSDTGTTLADCLASDFPEAGVTADANNAQILAGVTGVKTGDILICRKTSDTASCEPDDFQWLNITSGQFVNDRPANNDDVFRFTRMADHKITCERQHDGPGFSVDLGGFDIHAALYKNIQFSADIDRDSKIYEFQYASDLDSNKKGSEMHLFIDLDFTNSLFVHDDTDTNASDMTLDEFDPDYSTYEMLADEELARLIWFKPILLWENSSCEAWAPGDCQSVNTGVKAQVGVELSGDTEHPVYVCEDEHDPDVECVGGEAPSDSDDLQ